VFGQFLLSSNRSKLKSPTVWKSRGLSGPPKSHRFTTFKRDQSGATAVEFGLVAMPFIMMMAAIIDVGSYYLALNALDRGLDDASRFVRTGEAQTQGIISSVGVLDPKSVAAFKQKVCDKASEAGGNIDCSKMVVLMASATSWADIANADQSCTTGTSPNAVLKPSATASAALTSYVAGTSAFVIVTICYPWEMAKFLPFAKLGNLQDGSMLLQSSSAFQVEPY
jgi:Flp pilus assembly protein TadG